MSFQVETGLALHSDREAPVLTFPGLSAGGTVVHGITTRLGGVSAPPYHTLNLSLSVGDDPTAVSENRQRAARAVGLDSLPVVRASQVHGCRVGVIRAEAPPESPRADALATDRSGLALSMTYADCLPIILVDETVPVIGLVHAGWRGSVAGVAVEAWEAMRSIGARSETTVAYLGPSIGPCCYQIGEDVVERVLPLGASGEQSIERREDGTFLDLPGLNARLLDRLGVNVVRGNVCTSCHRDLFFSHRGDGGQTGRFAVYAALV